MSPTDPKSQLPGVQPHPGEVAAGQPDDSSVEPELAILRHYIQLMSSHADNYGQLPIDFDLFAVINHALQSVARLARIQQILASAGEPVSDHYQREMNRILAELNATIQAEPQSHPESAPHPTSDPRA